jgi:hypothetical protein
VIAVLVAEAPLLEGIVPKEVDPGIKGRCGTFVGLRHGRTVVTGKSDCALGKIAAHDKDCLVRDDIRELKIGDRQRPAGVVSRDRGVSDGIREPEAPKYWCHAGIQSIETHAVHAGATGVAGTHIRRCRGNQIAKPGRAAGDSVHEGTEISNCVVDRMVQSDTVTVAPAERYLQDGGKPTGTWVSRSHGTQLAQEPVPFCGEEALPRRPEPREDFRDEHDTVLGEV